MESIGKRLADMFSNSAIVNKVQQEVDKDTNIKRQIEEQNELARKHRELQRQLRNSGGARENVL